MRVLLKLSLPMLMLAGCANLTTYNRTVPLGSDMQMVFVDAKQRAMVTGTAGSGADAYRRFCAEPSPDAFSAIAATTGLNLGVASKGELGYSQGLAEGVASIGLRTQSIQILRDVMYRNCEAFMNKGVTDFGLETMQRRFQSTLVAVLAIEQLTGATKAQAIALGGNSRANNAETLGAAIKLVAETEAAAKAAQTQLDTAQAAEKAAQTALADHKKANPDDNASDTYKGLKDKAEKASAAAATAKETQAARQADLDMARSVRAAAATSGGSASIDVSFLPEGGRQLQTPDTKVPQAVVDIVRDTLELGFGREVCTTLFGHLISQTSSQKLAQGLANEYARTCIKYLETDIKASEAAIERAKTHQENQTKALEVMTKILDKVDSKKLSPADAKEMLDTVSNATKPVDPPKSHTFSAQLPRK
jgi:hypothetical protein